MVVACCWTEEARNTVNTDQKPLKATATGRLQILTIVNDRSSLFLSLSVLPPKGLKGCEARWPHAPPPPVVIGLLKGSDSIIGGPPKQTCYI